MSSSHELRYELETDKRWISSLFLTSEIWKRWHIVLLPTKYLMHKIRMQTVTKYRKALRTLPSCYYLGYIHEKEHGA